MIPTPTQVEISRFKSNLVTRDNGCIEWTGYKMKNGYGQLRYQSTTVYAHRFAYYIDFPNHDQNLCILHRCDNPCCCNTSHHFLGTRTDNANDKVAKMRHAVGQAVGGLLSDEDVTNIVILARAGLHTYDQIGRQFKVHPCMVSKIMNGRRWCHLTEKLGIKPATR